MASSGRDEGVTASSAGLSQQEQFLAVLREIESKGGVAQMPDIYQTIEKRIGQKLSRQGRDSLRKVVNTYMVTRQYVVKDHGWRITDGGKQLVQKYNAVISTSKLTVNIETFKGTDKDVDTLIQEQRLRIGCIDTGDELALSRRRQGQQRLRKLTLLNYSSKCAFCDVKDPSLLVAKHIVGWAEDQETRGFLTNIICLCRFHDVLFEKGYLSLADDLTVLKTSGQTSRTIAILLDAVVRFQKPSRHPPKSEFLRRHRLRCGFEPYEAG